MTYKRASFLWIGSVVFLMSSASANDAPAASAEAVAPGEDSFVFMEEAVPMPNTASSPSGPVTLDIPLLPVEGSNEPVQKEPVIVDENKGNEPTEEKNTEAEIEKKEEPGEEVVEEEPIVEEQPRYVTEIAPKVAPEVNKSARIVPHQEDFNLPWHDSLMFKKEEVLQINTSLGQYMAGIPLSNEAVAVVEKETPILRFYLNSILYIDEKRWSIWVNGKKISHNSRTYDPAVVEVSPSEVVLSWDISMLNEYSKQWSRNLLPDANSGIFYSATKDSAYDMNNGKLFFKLHSHQTFEVDNMVIKEGNTALMPSVAQVKQGNGTTSEKLSGTKEGIKKGSIAKAGAVAKMPVETNPFPKIINPGIGQP